jgi:5-methylcytosine-specific restriction endonuclease McrA
MSQHSMAGKLYDQLKRMVLAASGYTCHLCGHDGANSIDHLIPLSWGLVSGWDLAYWRAAHGGGKVCPTCRVECNSSRGNRGTKTPALNTSRRW